MVEGMPKVPFEIPNEMRDLAQKSLEQARRAVDTFLGAAEKASSVAEQSASSAQANARDMAQKSVNFAAQNMTATLAMMQQLVQAKGMEDVLKIQTEFMQSQMRALQEQAKSIGSILPGASDASRTTRKK